MFDRVLSKNEWQGYFDLISKHLSAGEVQIEVAGLDIGDQVETEWVKLEGLSYDPDNDSFFIHTTTLEHEIQHPQEIAVIEDGFQVRALGIYDRDGHLQIIKIREFRRLNGTSEVYNHQNG